MAEAGSAPGIAAVDALREEGKLAEEFTELEKLHIANREDVEIAWRFARSHLFQAYQTGQSESEMLDRGLAIARRALLAQPDHGMANKVAATLLGRCVDHYSATDKIKNSEAIRNYSQKAAEALPEDFEPSYLLARWCFMHASMGWLARKAAAALFAEPPTSTFEEALKYGQAAYALNPKYIRTVHILAQIHGEMGNAAESKRLYREVAQLPPGDKKEETYVADAKKKSS